MALHRVVAPMSLIGLHSYLGCALRAQHACVWCLWGREGSSSSSKSKSRTITDEPNVEVQSGRRDARETDRRARDRVVLPLA